MNKRLLVLLLLLFVISAKAQQKVIPLYNGPAPGSENWTWTEQENANNMYHSNAVYNVSKPTLTVYPPDSTYAPTGTAVIVCPGGGFHSLSIMQEGYAAVKWFQKRGITAFLLRYRLMHTLSDDPYKQENDDRNNKSADKQRAEVVGMAIADGKQAIAYVRQHATEYGISPSRIGIIGFSAGGTVAASAAYNYTPENRPDFAIPVYGYFPPEMQVNVPQDAPPIFICAATDDTYGLETHSVSLYNTWIASKHSAEIHIYSKGSHGFGMRAQGLPSDTWTDRLADWLDLQGFIEPAFTIKGKVSAKQAVESTKRSEEKIHTDWASLAHYEAKNDSLKTNPNTKPRVIFIGSSGTENWAGLDPAFFTNGYNNRGISGQTTTQMLVRFREDVIDLKPAAVVILGGINDIAQNTGPISVEDIFGNIQSMAELAKANHIRVVLSSLTPAALIPWRPAINPVKKIIDLNKIIKAYAAKMGFAYIDYYSALVTGDNKALNPKYTNEGLHMNLAGYKVMEPIAKKAIAETLKKKLN
jgi:acetyl esterase/lipase/lysophospholipase L1-like esterase